MTADHDVNHVEDEDYDEEADSDFDVVQADEDVNDTSEDDGADAILNNRPSKRRKKDANSASDPPLTELDSGDEATISEQKKLKRRKGTKEKIQDSGDESEGWHARTRAMRLQEKVEKKRNKPITSKDVTIDVDKIWEDMNKPGHLPPVHVNTIERPASEIPLAENTDVQDKENIPINVMDDMITIKRKFKFAGEVHVEEKLVSKSSAEAKLWLAQQEAKPQSVLETATDVQRPLRKISRFDPNYNNLAAFKKVWSQGGPPEEQFRGPKLNVVEKSKMDWASHVDAEGLKDELEIHAKAKEGYHSRMDFLSQVEQRREEEARLARVRT